MNKRKGIQRKFHKEWEPTQPTPTKARYKQGSNKNKENNNYKAVLVRQDH